MSHQQRKVPSGMNRFNYWTFSIAMPQTAKAGRPSIDETTHIECAKEFKELYTGLMFRTHNDPIEQELSRVLGRSLNGPEYALAAYIYKDKLWESDPFAWRLLKMQSESTKRILLQFDRKQWRRRSQWNWENLLRQIARDQELFMLIMQYGPAAAGVDSRSAEHPIVRIAQYSPSFGTAKRIYTHYAHQADILLGKGSWTAAINRALFQAMGVLNKCGRVTSDPTLKGIAALPQKEQMTIIAHWFAHALKNLVRYRQGRSHLSWNPLGCTDSCLKLQKRLMR